MNLTMIGPRVLIRPDRVPEVSDSGLHLVHDRTRITTRGTVVALGDGPRSRCGTTLPHVVAVGDQVIFSADSGEELIFERDLVIAMNEDSILAVIDQGVSL
jgi:chaperonin GroES